MSSHKNYAERRQRQRFAAMRDGKACIRIKIDGQDLNVIDLSIDGFSIAASAAIAESEFDFEMRLVDGFGDKVRGRAKAVNQIGEADTAQIGCRFVALLEQGEKTLQEWLTVIVICGASVRLTPADAESIVKGPSLI